MGKNKSKLILLFKTQFHILFWIFIKRAKFVQKNASQGSAKPDLNDTSLIQSHCFLLLFISIVGDALSQSGIFVGLLMNTFITLICSSYLAI